MGDFRFRTRVWLHRQCEAVFAGMTAATAVAGIAGLVLWGSGLDSDAFDMWRLGRAFGAMALAGGALALASRSRVGAMPRRPNVVKFRRTH